METGAEQPWISEASQMETIHEVHHKAGHFLLVYQMGLSSIHPLREEQVRQALLHLNRKCPVLRMCFGQRDNVTWLRHSIVQDIDFQVVNNIDASAVRDMLQTYQYNSETGPLWCARLLSESSRDVYALDEGYPHTSQLFLGFHHAIADGITAINICGNLITLLNDVISGKPINDDEQIGRFVSDTETETLVSAKIDVIRNDPRLLEELSAFSKDKGIGMPVLSSVIPHPKNGEDKTHNITHILDRDTTKRFIAKCKAEGVAVNSAFVGLTNASMVTFFIENNHIRDFYRMSNGHVLNLRRYWPGDTSQVLGCHAHFPLNLWSHVPRDIIENFWDFARGLHQDIHHHLKKETVLHMEAYMKLNSTGFEDNSSDPMQIDAGFSNLGDVTTYITEGGPCVKPYLLIRQVSLHRSRIENVAHFIHTLRGRLILNLIYNTKFVTKEVAEKHCSQIFDIMERVINPKSS